MKFRIIAPLALRPALPRLAEAVQETLGHQLDITYVLNPEIADHLRGSADHDLAIGNPWYLRELIAEGLLDATSHRAFVRSPLGIAVKVDPDGAPAETQEAIGRLLQQASRIGYTASGTSGAMLNALLQKLGLADQVTNRLVPLPGGASVTALAAGGIDLAVLPLTSIVSVPGVHVAGICPPELDCHIDMSIAARPDASRAARDILDHLCSPSLDDAILAMGGHRFRLDAPAPQ